jgi:hypothetical protein
VQHAADVARSDRNASVNLLNRLRVDIRQDFPAVAEALGRAANALHSGQSMEPALLDARRALFGAASSRPGIPEWSGRW